MLKIRAPGAIPPSRGVVAGMVMPPMIWHAAHIHPLTRHWRHSGAGRRL